MPNTVMWFSLRPTRKLVRERADVLFAANSLLRCSAAALVLALWLSVGSGCNRPTPAPPPQSPEPGVAPATEEEPEQPVAIKSVTMALSKADNGKVVSVSEGSEVVIALPSNPTTGYDWIVVEQSSALPQPKSEFIPPGSDNEGAGGTRRLTWGSAGLSGEHKITLVYKRPQDQKQPPADTFTVTLRIE
jgi:inhibitor of cysteine peptidase